MSIATDSVPIWYSKEEIECFEKIKELARTIPSATALVIEIEGSPEVLIECTEALPPEEDRKISQFNKGRNKLALDYVEESERVKGRRYSLTKSRHFDYEHKNIEFPKWENNFFLDSVKENFPRLMAIYDEDISYVSADYPRLVEIYGQLCKGVCKELLSIHKDKFRKSESDYRTEYKFGVFSDIISEYIPLSPTEEGYKVVRKNICKMEELYYPAMYERPATFDEFRSDFRRFESQLARMMAGLAWEYEKADKTIKEDLSNF